jgi:hypothetical protein
MINYKMMVPVSANLCVLSYLLRSLRIYKMFEAREEFCLTERLPRKLIQQYSEGKLLIGVVISIIIQLLIQSSGDIFNQKYTSYISLSSVINNHGLLKSED